MKQKNEYLNCPRCRDKSGFVAQGYGGKHGVRCQKCSLYLPDMFRKFEYKVVKGFYNIIKKIK